MKRYVHYLLLLTLFNNGLCAQNGFTKTIELQSTELNNRPADKMDIEFSFSTSDNSIYSLKFTIKTFILSSIVYEKEFSYNIHSNNVNKEFYKDLIIENIALNFFIRRQDFSNSKKIKKNLNKVFESAIQSVEYDKKVKNSDKEIKSKLKN